MEALDFVKLHSLYAHFSAIIQTTYPFLTSYHDEEDSFFDLDFISTPKPTPSTGDFETSGEKNPLFAGENDLRGLLSHPDLISKRKILPFELSSKPESPSPISPPKSAPRLSISLFKKPKLMAKQKMEEPEPSESKRFAFKLTRINSFRNNDKKNQSERQSKRFSREGVRKCLKLIKPFYVKVSKKCNSPESSPIVGGIQVVCRRLGKSKSSAAASSGGSPASRRDDSLLQQDDGIQSAILHCKRSFNGSRDGSCDLQTEKAGKDGFPETEEGEGH